MQREQRPLFLSRKIITGYYREDKSLSKERRMVMDAKVKIEKTREWMRRRYQHIERIIAERGDALDDGTYYALRCQQSLLDVIEMFLNDED